MRRAADFRGPFRYTGNAKGRYMRPLPWTVRTRKSVRPTHACVTPAGRRGTPQPPTGVTPDVNSNHAEARSYPDPSSGAPVRQPVTIAPSSGRAACNRSLSPAAPMLRVTTPRCAFLASCRTGRDCPAAFCLPVSEPAVYRPKRTVAVRLAGDARACKRFVREVVHRATLHDPIERRHYRP